MVLQNITVMSQQRSKIEVTYNFAVDLYEKSPVLCQKSSVVRQKRSEYVIAGTYTLIMNFQTSVIDFGGRSIQKSRVI